MDEKGEPRTTGNDATENNKLFHVNSETLKEFSELAGTETTVQQLQDALNAMDWANGGTLGIATDILMKLGAPLQQYNFSDDLLNFIVEIQQYMKNNGKAAITLENAHLQPACSIGPYTVLWSGGMPFVARFRNHEYIQESLILKIPREQLPGGLLSNILKIKDASNHIYYRFENKLYENEEFIKLIDGEIGQYRKYLRLALDILPVQASSFRPPAFYIENNHILFPVSSHTVTFARKPLQAFLLENLNIGPVDPEFVASAIAMLTAKQKLSVALITGQVAVNLLGVNDYNYTVELIGDRDTGKSFAVAFTNWYVFGLSPAYKLKGDALDSSFREMAALDSTNSILYVEESTMKSRLFQDLKSNGQGMRGTSSQGMNMYSSSVSLVFSRNTKPQELNAVEDEAVSKRILDMWFSKKDAIADPALQVKGKVAMDRMKHDPGGIIYGILKEKTVDELKQKYFQLASQPSGSRETLAEFGAWLISLDISGIPLDFGDDESEDLADDFASWYAGISYSLDGPEETYMKKYLSVFANHSELSVDGKLKINAELYNAYAMEHRRMLIATLKDFALLCAEKHPLQASYKVFRIHGSLYHGMELDVSISDALNKFWSKKFGREMKPVPEMAAKKTLPAKDRQAKTPPVKEAQSRFTLLRILEDVGSIALPERNVVLHKNDIVKMESEFAALLIRRNRAIEIKRGEII